MLEPCDPHGTIGEVSPRGFGSAKEKSARLLFVSVHPPLMRVKDFVAGGASVTAPSKQPAVP